MLNNYSRLCLHCLGWDYYFLGSGLELDQNTVAADTVEDEQYLEVGGVECIQHSFDLHTCLDYG